MEKWYHRRGDSLVNSRAAGRPPLTSAERFRRARHQLVKGRGLLAAAEVVPAGELDHQPPAAFRCGEPGDLEAFLARALADPGPIADADRVVARIDLQRLLVGI